MSDLMLAGFMDCTRFLSYYGVTDKALSCLTVESHLHKSERQIKEVRFHKLYSFYKVYEKDEFFQKISIIISI